MAISLHDQFTHEVEAFLARTGMGHTSFGAACLGDPRFIADLRGGRSPSARTIDKVRAFMAECEAA